LPRDHGTAGGAGIFSPGEANLKISTLSIGDELILGQVTDTNSGTIARALLEHGLSVQRHVTIGDNEPDISGTLDDLSRDSDVLIVTGGLGPTADDLTAGAVARSVGRPLVVNEEARQHVHNTSVKISSLIVSPLDDKQALIPASAALIPNPTGTACGFHLRHNHCTMMFLPGVPLEMIRMLHDSVIPLVLEKAPKHRAIQFMYFNVFGPCEAEVDELLRGIAQPDQGLHLDICVTFPWMKISLRAERGSEKEADALLQPAACEVRERLKDYIFSEGADTLDDAVATLFRDSGLTLALAESCTGGMLAQHISSVPGSSAYFMEGQVTYSNAAKTRRLGVPALVIEEQGAVSSEVASAMAKGVRSTTGSDLGLSVTGIAGPEGGSQEKPVGTVFISLAAADGCWTKRFQFNGSRDQVRTITTWTALDWLRRYLLRTTAN
jgi:nicotinamide-nucleotide amidase